MAVELEGPHAASATGRLQERGLQPELRAGVPIVKTNKQRGGGYGTNCAQKDPNFSIYNTRELTLFPYNPTK